jgi:rhomboid protease GluP
LKLGGVIAWGWATSIVVVWIVVAAVLGQAPWTQQHSIALMTFGAFEGQTFSLSDSWKLLASQWLHVKFLHMLFNAGIIGLVGAALSRRMPWGLMLLIGLVGGGLGQLAGALSQPTAYISGASQAYLALCGAGLFLLPRRSKAFWVAVVGTVVSVALDLFVAQHGGIKPGHSVSFTFGLIAGLLYLFVDKHRLGQAIPRRV